MNEPLVETELAFVLGAPLVGPGVNAVDVIRATEFVLPCIEVVDTRQRGRGPNRLVDSIADAAACGRVVLGGCPARLTDVDIRRIGASLSINGSVEQSGVASAVMGNPINAVAWLANKLHPVRVVHQGGSVRRRRLRRRPVRSTRGSHVRRRISRLCSERRWAATGRDRTTPRRSCSRRCTAASRRDGLGACSRSQE